MALEKYRETIAMKAFILNRYGSADGVRVGHMPGPELREDDVLVQVHAAGVNLLDSKIRKGEFKRILPYRLPLILGHDVAGVVARVGSRVRRFRPGDEVYARPVSGPPDAAFARSLSAGWVLRTIMGVLSYRIRTKAKRRQAHYSFLFMRANGQQLTEITALIDDSIIRPVVDRVFPFASTKEAMANVESGRAKGKVVLSLR
jgi:NADPH:quinone reductase-like Zn-dependent oxidoreductase